MAAEGVEAAHLTDPVSIAYLTGFRTDPHERLMALAVRASGAVLVVPGLEADSARTAAAAGVEVRGWRDGEDPLQAVAEALGPAPGRLAVETERLTLAAFERLTSRVAAGDVVDAGAAVRGMRLRKRPDELALMERAAVISDRVLAALAAGLRLGTSELEVAGRITTLIAAEGAEPAFESIVQFGTNSAQPHLRPTSRPLATGDLVLLDFGAAWQGYRADITRTLIAGEPDDRQREVHRLVLEAHDRALAAVRPGLCAGEVDEAARRVIREAGHGDHFQHRVGHGLGLELHEDPSLDPGSALVLEAGMTFTVEPGLYIPGWGGVRIEDDVVVEAAAGRSLTGAGRALTSVARG